MLLGDIESAIRSDDSHFPTTRLICLENTHNRCGGVALSAGYTAAVGELARQNGLLLHLDGARLFNAAAATGASARRLAAPADSVTFCLSKGLCAPVGSVLCGSREFIYRAHRIRKQVGGGMRQAGVLAAAGIVALQQMTGRLAEDHARARRLAAGLADLPGVQLDPGTPYTNMIFLNLAENEMAVGILPAGQRGHAGRFLAQQLEQRGIKVGVAGRNRFRLVMHYWIDDRAVDRTIQAFTDVLQPVLVG
jgi:threonine aldolase